MATVKDNKFQFIKTERRGKKNSVALVQLNRPEALNALSHELLRELATALEQFDNDNSISAVVVTGNDNVFAAGADIKGMEPLTFSQVYAHRNATFQDCVSKVRKPIIAAVNGYALGGGMEIAMMCDVVYAGENAKFGQPEILIGTIPGWGGTQRLPRTVGKSLAMEMVLTGRRIGASQAQAAGLVSKVFPSDQVVNEAVKLGEKISAQSQITTALAKESVNVAFETNLQQGLQFERRISDATFATDYCNADQPPKNLPPSPNLITCTRKVGNQTSQCPGTSCAILDYNGQLIQDCSFDAFNGYASKLDEYCTEFDQYVEGQATRGLYCACRNGNNCNGLNLLQWGVKNIYPPEAVCYFPGKVVNEAVKLGEKISAQSQITTALAKESVNVAFETNLQQGLQFERRISDATFATDYCNADQPPKNLPPSPNLITCTRKVGNQTSQCPGTSCAILDYNGQLIQDCSFDAFNGYASKLDEYCTEFDQYVEGQATRGLYCACRNGNNCNGLNLLQWGVKNIYPPEAVCYFPGKSSGIAGQYCGVARHVEKSGTRNIYFAQNSTVPTSLIQMGCSRSYTAANNYSITSCVCQDNDCNMLTAVPTAWPTGFVSPHPSGKPTGSMRPSPPRTKATAMSIMTSKRPWTKFSSKPPWTRMSTWKPSHRPTGSGRPTWWTRPPWTHMPSHRPTMGPMPNGVFMVLLENFDNSAGGGRLFQQGRCDPFWFSGVDQCDIALQVCVEPLNSDPSMIGCVTGWVDLGQVTTNKNVALLEPGCAYGGWTNPMQYPLKPFAKNLGFQLKYAAFDVDNGGRQLIDFNVCSLRFLPKTPGVSFSCQHVRPNGHTAGMRLSYFIGLGGHGPGPHPTGRPHPSGSPPPWSPRPSWRPSHPYTIRPSWRPSIRPSWRPSGSPPPWSQRPTFRPSGKPSQPPFTIRPSHHSILVGESEQFVGLMPRLT